VPPLQHPLPPHLSPGQQAWCGAPQDVQAPPVHVPPNEHVPAAAAQRPLPGSQQPLLPHVEPGQQSWAVSPHASQSRLLLQA
jgi:hypothetical protein